MQYTVNILHYEPRRDFDTDNYECWVRFSIIETSLIGTPRERESIHVIKIVMTDFLMDAWRLPGAIDNVVTDDMLKIALQSLEEHLSKQLQKGIPQDKELAPIHMTTKDSPVSCPYKISNIGYPDKKSFVVDIQQKDGLKVHPNIQILFNRMDDALKRDDYSGVLHSSASIFETLAKEVVGIPTVQDQTLKSFFDRYRKDSTLPDEILDYILSVYESRNKTPLAGHGSTSSPSMTKNEALTLCEMTKAFVRIEYKLREKNI